MTGNKGALRTPSRLRLQDNLRLTFLRSSSNCRYFIGRDDNKNRNERRRTNGEKNKFNDSSLPFFRGAAIAEEGTKKLASSRALNGPRKNNCYFYLIKLRNFRDRKKADALN